MKKMITVLIILSLTLAVAGCNNNSANKKKKSTTTTEKVTLSDKVALPPTTEFTPVDSATILEPASRGEMLPNAKAKIGDNYLTAYGNREPEAEYNTSKPSVLFSEARYYYEDKATDENQPIYKIVVFDEAYGFTCGVTTMDEVKKSLGEQEEKIMTREDIYFLLNKDQETRCISYKAGENTLEFYFADNEGIEELVAVVLESHE